jgi:hypothetical protein
VWWRIGSIMVQGKPGKAAGSAGLRAVEADGPQGRQF